MMSDRTKLIVGTVVAIAAVAMTFVLPDFRLYQLAAVSYWATAMLGLNLLTGFNGQISIGHATFMAIGGYTVAILVRDQGLSYPLTMLLAFVVCFVVGGLVGIPALRLPGISLALITLAMSLAFPQLLKHKSLEGLTGGSQGIATPSDRMLNAPEWSGLTNDQFRYLVLVMITAAVFLVVFNIVRGRWGLALMAVRDNPVSAASMGVNLSRTKVITFAVSAGLAGLAGAMQMALGGFVSPDSFTILTSIQLLTGIVVGGLATVLGALLGGFFQVYLLNFANQLSEAAPGAIFGALIILVMILAPGGIIGTVRVLRSKAFKRSGSTATAAPAET